MSNTRKRGSARYRVVAGAGAVAVVAGVLPTVVGAAVAAPSTAVISEPPRAGKEIVVFPQRDFVSASGYALGDTVTVEVQHPDGTVRTTASGLVPQDDDATPEFDGIVEVNHPGGACWGVPGNDITPDIRPGDKVRVYVDSGPDAGHADQTTVADVTAGRPAHTAPGTVVVRGTAQDANGAPLVLDQIEHRLVSPGNLFAKSGRRTLRAPVDGTIAYDAQGSGSWTATYTGLSDADVQRALEAESRALWLGTAGAASTELTIFENGAGVTSGPQAPCTAPFEKLPPPPGSDAVPPSAPGQLVASALGSTVTLSWGGATDDVGVRSYGVYRNGVAIANVQMSDGASPAPTGYVDKNVPPGTYTYTVDAADEWNRGPLSNEATATAEAQQAADLPFNDPPVGKEIVAFPSRDFVEVVGFAEGELATVQLIRNGKLISTASGMIPQDDPATTEFDGVVEVNHPGGACWEGTTPEIRPGDVVQALAYGTDAAGERVLTSVDRTTVANVTATRAVPSGPGSVRVTGTAMDAAGRPLDIGQLEQRLISGSAARFDKNERRALLAPGDGVISYDATDNPTGVKWTAVYTGLSDADVQKALSVESRVLWLGRAPLAGNELTIFEVNGGDPPGPSAGFCDEPLEPADVTAPGVPVLTVRQSSPTAVQLDWDAVTDDHYVYGYRVYRDGELLANVGGGTLTYTDRGVVGEHTYAVAAIDSASPRGTGATDVERLHDGQGQPYGNLSARSEPRVITLADVTPPTAPSGLIGTAAQQQDGTARVDLNWQAAVDDVGVTSYRVYRRVAGTPDWEPQSLATVPATTHADVITTASGTYEYAVEAVDAAGNGSAKSGTATVNVTVDVAHPTAPTDVRAATPDIHARDVAVTWRAATDDVGVTAYRVFRDGGLVATVSDGSTAHLDRGVPAGTHAYTVEATDSAGKVSPRSDPPATAVVADDPPAAGREIVVFPQRDFVSASGYPAGDYIVSLIRGGMTFKSTVVTAADDPTTSVFDGLLEVNHGGNPNCWTVNTPDIRPGDVVRVSSADGTVVEQTTTADVTAGRAVQTAAGTVVVRGTATSPTGGQIDPGQLEHRLISGGANFTLNGRRALLAPGDGTIVYDAPGSTRWTATYTGLSAADVTRAVNAESRVLWLGRAPLTGNELTIYENAAGVTGGPATPDCTAPLAPDSQLASAAPSTLAFGDVSATPAATRDLTATVSNSGSVPLTIRSVYVAGANFPEAFTVGSNTCPASLPSRASCTISVLFAPRDVGPRSATLVVATQAANQGDLGIALTGNGIDAAAPSTPGAPVQTLPTPEALTVRTGTAIGTSTMRTTLTWAASTGTVTHYKLQQSVNGGTYSDVALPAGTANRTTLDLAIGTVAAPRSYQFRVQGCNGPNCTVWTAGPRFTILPVDDADTRRISYGGSWTSQTLAGAYGGTVRHASTARDKATLNKIEFRVSGNFAWVSTLGPNRGRADVLVDGVRRTTVDLYSSSTKPGHVVFSTGGLAPGEHTITIQVLGTKATASTGTRVDVDAFVALF